MAEKKITGLIGASFTWDRLTREERSRYVMRVAERPVRFGSLLKVMTNPTCLMCSMQNPRDMAHLEFHMQTRHGISLFNIIEAYEKKP